MAAVEVQKFPSEHFGSTTQTPWRHTPLPQGSEWHSMSSFRGTEWHWPGHRWIFGICRCGSRGTFPPHIPLLAHSAAPHACPFSRGVTMTPARWQDFSQRME